MARHSETVGCCIFDNIGKLKWMIGLLSNGKEARHIETVGGVD